MSSGRVTVTMQCEECGTEVFMTLATPDHPFHWSRGRVTLPRSITEHVCPPPKLTVPQRLALWEKARPAISALYGGSRQALTDDAQRAVCNALGARPASPSPDKEESNQ